MHVGRIYAALAVVFLALALRRVAADGWRIGPASRTWLLVGSIFAAVSVWLGWR